MNLRQNISRYAEITERKDSFRGWVVYDAECAFCRSGARRWGKLLLRRGFRLAALQSAWARGRLPAETLLNEMRLIEPEGRVLGGADALLQIARTFWWARPFAALAGLPVFKPALRRAYLAFARRRHCAGGACAAPPCKRRRTIVFLEMP